MAPTDATVGQAAGTSSQNAAKSDSAKNASAVDGAKAVADAVTKVANAAVAEVQKVPTVSEPADFRFSGRPGGKFSIRGEGFGTNGTLKLAGRQVETTEWGPSTIEGRLPADLPREGDVVVHIDDKTSQRAPFKF